MPDITVQEVIRKHLAALQADLGQFEQTTHGVLFLCGVTINDITTAVERAYNNPTAFNISELSQRLDRFLQGDATAKKESGG